jgi:hypothetical protein
VKKPLAVHIKKNLALLKLAERKAAAAQIRWRSADIGPWKSVNPRWWVSGNKIYFQFCSDENRLIRSIISIKPKSDGVGVFLSNPSSPIADLLEVLWAKPNAGSLTGGEELWNTVQYFLQSRFPGHRVLKAYKKPDLRTTISGAFLRVLFRHRGKDSILVAGDLKSGDEAHLAISQALLWLLALTARGRQNPVSNIYILVPSKYSAALGHRCRYLSQSRVRVKVWAYKMKTGGNPEVRHASHPPSPKENRDFRWPVLGPFRWSGKLEQVLNLAPNLIRRHPRFQDYDSLRICGLEFARVVGVGRDRIFFGVGRMRTELNEGNFDRLHSLIKEILYYRRAESPDIQHPYYRLQSERWLEALILDDVPRLFPEMAAESVYSQIPVYLGKDPGRIDVLGADRQGTLVVMELKVSSDPDLPLQALDYWGRVIQHNKNGDFERRGYFSEVRLNRRRPKIYLIAPIFSFHDSTELLLRYLDPDLDIWKISINNDWRCGVRILRRLHYRCRELT